MSVPPGAPQDKPEAAGKAHQPHLDVGRLDAGSVRLYANFDVEVDDTFDCHQNLHYRWPSYLRSANKAVKDLIELPQLLIVVTTSMLVTYNVTDFNINYAASAAKRATPNRRDRRPM